MKHLVNLRNLLAAGVLAISVTGTVPAQEFVLPYNKAPETAQEFWAAAKYDLSLGNQQRAAQMFGNYYDKVMAFSPEEQKKYFLNMYDTEGVSPLLRLSTIPAVKQVMRKDPATGTDKSAVDILIARMTGFIDARLSDQERIRFFVGQLNKRPEERAYAIAQLRASGARSVPAMLDVLRDPAQQSLHGSVYNALLKMDSDIGPPLLAALDTKSDFVKSTIVDVFINRADSRIVPDLFYLSEAKSSTPPLKAKAKEWLTKFLSKSEKELADPRVALVDTAELFHKHQVDLNGQKHHVWMWNDQTGLSGQPATATQVEESRGIAYARKALDLDPSYRPAQIELLSLALDKLYERGGPSVSVAKANPDLQALLVGAPSDLLEDVLAKALKDGNTNAALGATRALAAHGDPNLLRTSERGVPALLQALRYHDRRVKFAAAEAALAINSKGEPFDGSSRVVEVLKYAAGGNGNAKILVALGNSDEGNRLAEHLRNLKYDVEVIGSGKRLMEVAGNDGNVALVITDSSLPQPGFSYFLSQFKHQPNTAGLPLLLIAEGSQARLAGDELAKSANVKIINSVPKSPELIQAEVNNMIGDKTKPAFSDAERAAQAKAAVDALARMAKGELANFDLKHADPALLKAVNDEALATSAATALAHRPSREAQAALAKAVLNEGLTPATRTAIAASLRAHIHRFGNQLNQDQVKSLINLALSSKEGALREQADLIASTLRGDPSVIGNRLKGFVPSSTPPATKVEPGKEGN